MQDLTLDWTCVGQEHYTGHFTSDDNTGMITD